MDETLTFDEQIVEAAKSIAKATSQLVKAATDAQRELVAQGRVSDQGCRRTLNIRMNLSLFWTLVVLFALSFIILAI